MAANQTKNNATNTFEGGMVTDVHPLRVDNKSLVYAKNVDFVAAGAGSQLILQKRDGTSRVVDPNNNNAEVKLTVGFIPIVAAELDNIIYIISYNPTTSVGEIGSYPSPAYSQSTVGIVPLELNYKPLNNFHDGSSNYGPENFHSPFTTPYLSFTEGRFVDMRLSKSYDSSVNIIFTDEVNPIRLVNTRFSVLEDGKNVELITHRSGNGTNSYSETFFNQTELIPTSLSIPKLTFGGLSDGGNLEGGGYRYFFRYVKDDGAQTDVIEESRLVNVHQGNSDVSSYGVGSGDTTTKSVSFTLENLDDSYYGIKVYYTIATGDADAVTKAMVIDTVYKINNSKCSIVHTGFEPVLDYDKSELTLRYSTISNSKTLTVSNDRLIVANTEDYYTTNSVYESLASSLEIEEGVFDIYHDNTGSVSGLSEDKASSNYANANFTYNNLGYWKGETYELGVVFISDKGLSAVYPIKGMDRIGDTFNGSLTPYPVLDPNNVFGTSGVNTKGVYRTAGNGQLWNVSGSDIIFKGTKLKVDVSSLLVELPNDADIAGFVKSEEATVNSVPCGWRVYYETGTGQYYIRGVVSNENLLDTSARIDLSNTPGIPAPQLNIKFGAIEISSTGLVYNRGVANGTDLTKLYGPPVDARSSSKGFFFVRRKRIKDKILEGVMIPVGAYPTETRGDAGKNGEAIECGYPGNWIGIGLNSFKKDNVVLAPAPSLCASFGNTRSDIPSESTILTNYTDNNGVPVEVTSTVIIDPTLPQYIGISSENKTVDVPLSYISAELEDGILFDKISVASGYTTTGIPCTFNAANNTITIKLIHLASTVDKIVKGTKILINKSISKLQNVSGTTDIIIRGAVNDYDSLKSWAFYSPDIECSPAEYASKLNNSFNLTLPLGNIEGDVISLVNPDPYNSLLPYFTKLKGYFNLDTLTPKIYSGDLNYVGDGMINTGSKSFTGILDRVLYVWYYPKDKHNNIQRSLQDDGIRGYDDPRGVQMVSRTNAFWDKIVKDGIRGQIAEYWDATNRRFGNGLKFGRYAGIRIEEFSPLDAPLAALNNSHPVASGAVSSDNVYRTINYFSSLTGFNTPFTEDAKFAAYCQVRDAILTYDAWKQLYNKDTDTEYFAISRRFAYEEFDGVLKLDPVIDLYGGDCYLGLSWKQVWYPRGIEEAPQATDIKAYAVDNRNLCMLNYGYVIPIPAQSNYNFNIRSKDKSDVAEYRALGKERSFIPVRPLAGSRGNRIFDTGVFNKGYAAQDMSDNRLFKLSDSAPYYKEAFPNRIYASESFQENNFINGFTIFKGFNYKDYNSELGPIHRLITLSDKLYAIFRDGIGIIGISERTQVSSDTGGVYIDNADVLAQKAQIISTGFGSTKPNSVISTNNYIYGLDANRAKIWRTNGGAPEMISDVRIQTILTEILSDIESLGNDSWNDVYATFDPFKGDVSFTFIAKDRTNTENYILRTLIFNEFPQTNCWICETDDHRKVLATASKNRFSLTPIPGKEHIIYKYDNDVTFGGNNVFYDVQEDAVVRYSVVDDPGSAKVFENIWLAGDNPLPDSVKYMSDGTYDNGEWKTQTLNPYTNVAYYAKRLVSGSYVQCTGSITSGSKTLTVDGMPTMAPPGRTEVMIPGDYISLEKTVGNVTTKYNFTVIKVVGNVITVDKPINTTVTDGLLIFGYKTPIYSSDSSIEDGYGKIVCLNGTSFKTKPRGKWMRFEMTFSGEDQVYIGAIVTSYSKSFS